MRKFWACALDESLNTLFPHPERICSDEIVARKREAHAEVRRIAEIGGSKNAAALLETARLVLAEEDGRKAGAEARATAFLAAVAALIPLMTWAVGTASPVCSPGLGCGAWSAALILAVFYLMAAGFWSLRTFAVDTYHCLGVEEVRRFAYDADFELAVAKETLRNARLNRDTINRKLVFIKCAQRCFYQALFLLAVLLMCDPIARFHMLSGTAPATAGPATSAVAPITPSAVVPPSPPALAPSAAPVAPDLTPVPPPPSKTEPPPSVPDKLKTEAQSIPKP